MTPTSILLCTTLVTAIPHGSVVQRNCRFVEPPFIASRTTVSDVLVKSALVENVVVSRPPVAKSMAKPISKPTVKLLKAYRPKLQRRVARRPTLHRNAQVVVLPVATEIPVKKAKLSLWEKLKRFELFN